MEEKKEKEKKLEVLCCLISKLMNKKIRTSFESNINRQNQSVMVEFENEEEHRKINENQKYIRELRMKLEERDR